MTDNELRDKIAYMVMDKLKVNEYVGYPKYDLADQILALIKEHKVSEMCFVSCSRCGKRVSNWLPSKEGIIVRAWVECPECIEEAEC